MGFAAPLALFALALLAIPLAIHLRPRRIRRLLRVGSIRHLAGAAVPRRTGVQLTERSLLAVRLAIVGLLALALAGPFLVGSRAAPPRKIALVAVPLARAPAGTVARRIVDSLRRDDVTILELDSSAEVWGEIRAADASLPPGSSIALVWPERARVGGTRPTVSASVSVHLVPTAPDSAVGGRPAPASARDSAPAPARHRVTIVAAPSRGADARFLAAAFRAIAAQRGDSLELAMTAARSHGGPRWLVWLPDSTTDSLPPDELHGGGYVLTDGGAPGGPPLAAARHTGALTFTFGGRFSADSTALMLTGALPELLATIWPDPLAGFAADTSPRRVSASQLLPDRAQPQRSGGSRIPLSSPLIAAAALLFLAERWMAHRRPAGTA